LAGNSKAQADRIAQGLTWRQLVELEACTRCGECQVWCPVYAQDKREALCARGKLEALRRMVDGTMPEQGQTEFLNSLYECSACGQCHVVCPVRINTPTLWEQARQSLAKAGIRQPESQLKLLSVIKEFDNSYGKPQEKRGRWAELAWEEGFLLKPLTLWRDKPSSFLYFAGCTASFDPAMQAVAVQSARLLQEAGVEFSILGEEEPCCVGKLRRMGDGAFPEEARKRVAQFENLGIREIIVSCAGCYKGLNSDYTGLRLWPEGQRIIHLTQMIERLILDGCLSPRFEVPIKVTYHDPCHLGRHNQIYDEPRRILGAIPGLKLVEMPRHREFSSCCGMGGGLNVAFRELQYKMSASRIREAEATGAEAVVTPCQTCYKGLLNGVEQTSSRMQVLHLNELLIRSLCPEATGARITEAFARHIPS